MEVVPSSKKPPRNLSKQKSCGHLLQGGGNGKYDAAGRYNRGCLTPNPKMTTHRTLQRSESTTSKTELQRSLKGSSADSSKTKVRSSLRKTPRPGKPGVPGNTPRSTPAGTKSPMRSYKGKTKRDFDKEKDNIRPKKRLAIAYDDDATDEHCQSIEEQKRKGLNVLESKSHLGSGLIPIAEVKPLPVVRKLNDDKYDLSDGKISDDYINNESTLTYKVQTTKIHPTVHQEEARPNRDVDSGDFSVYVAVRVRPFTKREEQNKDINCVVEVVNDTICVTESNGNFHNFTYDRAFWSFDSQDPWHANQEKVYASSAQPLLDGVQKGYNTCLFAYGQTGSGKSYTMTGYDGEDAGIIPRFCKELFQRIQSDQITRYTLEISFFEIYNEKIRDLLSYSPDNTKQLRIREHPEHGPYVQDLSIFTVTCWEDIEGWLAVGNKNRATAATGMNDRSSRSHSVFTILLSQFETEIYEGTETQVTRTSKVNLIDLAGSERANQVISDDIAGDHETVTCRLKEGSCINRSLHTLGKVISLLSESQTESKKKVFIPYRESTLTWLLKESLGGNSRTAMIATISPSNIHVAETLSTLRYARQARNIVNQVRVNEDANAKMIRELLREIDRLKSTKVGSDIDNEYIEPIKAEVDILKEKLIEANAKLAEATREWENKLRMSENRWKEETEKIKQCGLASQIDNTLPSLVNLNEDPMLSEVLVYVLRNGHTTFGNSLSQSNHDIKLNGPLVADNHCCITNEDQDVKIKPSGDSPVYVNGEQITSSVVLKHGDRIVIGGTHFFRFNYPTTNSKDTGKENKSERKGLWRKPSKRELRRKWDNLTLKDFDFAKKELTQQQNAKLEAELEESQVKAQEGLIELIANAKETAEKQLSLQRKAYKEEITELQKNLEEAECKRRIAEKNRNLAEDRLIQLKSHQQALEEEIQNNRKRLQEEATAARKAFEETRASQMQIIAELEAEKQRIEDDVKNIKNRKLQRSLVRNEIRSVMASANGEKTTGKKDLLKIALLLREANKISEKLRKNITFSRDDILEENEVEIRIRLNDTRLGRTTLWSLEKFEIMVGKMRDLYQANGKLDEGEEDPFYESTDEWMDDFILDSPTIAEPGFNSSRMSIGRRQSLNHSLHLLTNLNASLSDLSKRRKSSIAFTRIQESERRQEPLITLAAVYERINSEPAHDLGDLICKRVLAIVVQINDKITSSHTNTGMSSGHTKQVLDVAVLLTTLKECGKTWEKMQSIIKGSDLINNEMTSLNENISKLVLECKTLFQPITGGLNLPKDRIADALMKVVSCVGRLSLLSIDCIDGQSKAMVCPVQESLFYRSFLQGQQEMWFELIRRWSNEVDNLLQKLRNLQLISKDNIEFDLDQIVNLLNSSLTMFACSKDFLGCWYEHFMDEDPFRLLTEKFLHDQRHLIGNLLRFVDTLKYLVSSARTAQVTNDDDVKSFHDRLHLTSKCCVNNRNIIAKIIGEANMRDSQDHMMVNSLIKEKLGKLQFATKAIQVGVAVISQNLDELCFPAGRFSICLDEKNEEIATQIVTIISPFLMQNDQDL